MRLYASNSRTSKSARRHAQLHRPMESIHMTAPRVGTDTARKRADDRPRFRLADILDFGRTQVSPKRAI